MGEHAYVEATTAFVAITCPRLRGRVCEMLQIPGIRVTSSGARLLLVDVATLQVRKDVVAMVRGAVGDRRRILVIYTGEQDEHFAVEGSLRDFRSVSHEVRNSLAEHALKVCDQVEAREVVLARAESICATLAQQAPGDPV